MKLTIGMIVKNEEKYLDRCLAAIKPLLDNVDSELIITDTGSSDRTVEIAEKYTDKVFHFDWVNDFSAARNSGLEKAQGEWFMMLDADDIFRSCDNLISFFNSGEYRKYNAASYLSRNLINTENGTRYSDIWAPRLVKIKSGTRYEGCVHEYLTTFAAPFRNIPDIADHYGYYYENDEQRLNKFRRNKELLLKRYETEKDTTPMLFVQLYEAYSGAGEQETALEFLEEGIVLAEKLNSIVLVALYFHKISYYYTNKEYETVIRLADEYFGIGKNIRPHTLNTDAEIFAIRAMSYFSLERYDSAIADFKSYFEIFRDIGTGKTATYDAYLISNFMCTDINWLPLFNNFIRSCLAAGRYNTADSYLCNCPLHRYSFEPSKISELTGLIIRLADEFSYGNINRYYRQLDAAGRKMLADELFFRLLKNGGGGNAFKALAGFAGMSERIDEKFRIYSGFLGREDVSPMIYDYAGKYGVNEDTDLIYISLLMNYDISVLFEHENTDIRLCALLCCRQTDNFYEAAENYTAGALKDPDKAVMFYDSCIKVRLIDNEDKTKEEKERIIKKLFEVKTSLKTPDTKQAARADFERLAAAVKRNIRSFIAAGSIEAAAKTLEEYTKIAADDPEISVLRDEINGRI